MAEAADTNDFSEDENGYNPKEHFKVTYDMTDGLVALFEDFMLRNEYEEALNLICDCYNISPTSFVISEIIFKVMMTCDPKLCSKALNYLEQSLRLMPTDDDHKYIFIEGLKDKTGSFGDIWSAFDHFVLSSLRHRKISDGYISLKDYVKYPNCDYLVQIFVYAFLRGPFKSTVFGSHPEEKFSALVKWINVFYKYNAEMDELLKNLHLLLDHIFDDELLIDSAIPKCAAIYKAPISKYILILVSSCKDVFHLENQQRFFNFTESSYLILKICQQRLDGMLVKDLKCPNSVLTLKSIVEDYFFEQQKLKSPKQEPMEEGKSPRKSRRRKKPMTPSKNPKFLKLKSGKKRKGDTNFHVCCRSNRFDNLLEALYTDKSKDINVKNCLGFTPLHEACLVGSFLCCKFLIEESGDRKVDFRAVDDEGLTPLHFAVSKKALDIVKLLLKRGGSDLVKYRDIRGKKPIDYSECQEIGKILQDTELQLKPSDDESQKSSDSIQHEPNLKKSEDLPLYIRTLRSLIGTYCEIYDIPKHENDSGVKLLSHCDEECSHYKASAEGTLCMEDSSTLATMNENIKKLSACVKSITTDVNMQKELRGLDILAASFV